MPRAFEERPEVTPALEPYIEAFLTLTHFRSEMGGLSFCDVVCYAKTIEEENILEFVSIIIAADKAYLKATKEDKDLKGMNQNGR